MEMTKRVGYSLSFEAIGNNYRKNNMEHIHGTATYVWDSIRESAPTTDNLKGLLKGSAFAAASLVVPELLKNLTPPQINALGAFVFYLVARGLIAPHLAAWAEKERGMNAANGGLAATVGMGDISGPQFVLCSLGYIEHQVLQIGETLADAVHDYLPLGYNES